MFVRWGSWSWYV